jgi:hypothetical protein
VNTKSRGKLTGIVATTAFEAVEITATPLVPLVLPA